MPQNKKWSNAKERENERKTGDKEVEGATFHSWLNTLFRKYLPMSFLENTPSSLSGIHLFISNLLLSIYHEPGTEVDPETVELSDTWPLSSRNHRMLRNEQRKEHSRKRKMLSAESLDWLWLPLLGWLYKEWVFTNLWLWICFPQATGRCKRGAAGESCKRWGYQEGEGAIVNKGPGHQAEKFRLDSAKRTHSSF